MSLHFGQSYETTHDGVNEAFIVRVLCPPYTLSARVEENVLETPSNHKFVFPMATFWVVVDQKGITVTIKRIFLESDLIKMVCLHPISMTM